MSAGAAEDELRPEQASKAERSRREEEEEEAEQQGVEGAATAPLAPNPAGEQEEWKEAPADGLEMPDKGKPARVQSVFSLVRSQIRAQTGLESRRSGMLQLVQRVTRQLDRSKAEQAGSVPDPEATSPGEEAATAPEAEAGTVEEVVVVVEKEGGSREEVCATLLQEVLDSVESLRREVREELRLLRQESRSHTEQALLGLETRLVRSLRARALATQVTTMTHALPRPHPTLSVPPLGVSRRRTLTTITAKTCPPPGLGPRSMSEPLGPRAAEASPHSLRRGADPLGSALGPLPPSLPLVQHGKQSLRGKTRVGKPAP
ncbi:hypothetical protein P4O66_003069 [Electrophorus voltai]|uniref:Uncharacterized protein n=1 Tax=Electrophorus voltai TaxID=2609070 RepID=A0AAD9DNY0_9TELE|nr:hypothetical protein P4O66_003069 [Electrophorus voltai]